MNCDGVYPGPPQSGWCTFKILLIQITQDFAPESLSPLFLSSNFSSSGTWQAIDDEESIVHSMKGPVGGAVNKANCLGYWQ